MPLSDLTPNATSDPRTPVTLLTGFLGAGKTTLLNAVLSDAGVGPIAVIVNEFGDAGLDHDLIESVDEEVVLMQSGCLCCSVRGDLSRTVADLIRRRKGGEIAFDRIVIETTGLADPGPILQTMQVDPYLARQTHLDGVVTVADAVNGPKTLDAQFEAMSQAAMADLIVLSKSDLASPAEVMNFEDRLRSINPAGRILRAIKGEGVTAHLWGLSGMRQGAGRDAILSWASGPTTDADTLTNLSGLTRPEPSLFDISPHDERIATASTVIEHPLSDEVFDGWLNTLIALRGPNILRVKGIVFLEGIEAPFAFHGVQHIFEPPVPLRDWPKEDRSTRIVVIARDMTRYELQRSLDMLRARPKQNSSLTIQKEASL